MPAHILVVDDEPDILELLHYNLIHQGYIVTCAATGEEALTRLHVVHPDLVVLDLMLPGLDGLDVCKAMKRHTHTANIPILMLSARDEESDVVAGLELGADDYLTKPFSPRVLLARVKVLLRGQQINPLEKRSVIRQSDLILHPDRHEVTVCGESVHLSVTEFRILYLLAQRPGRVYSRGQILDIVYGQDAAITERSIDVHIVALRRKLGICGARIETVRGVGYRYQEKL